MDVDCQLCAEVNMTGSASSEYARVYPEGPPSRVLLETDDLLVIPDLSPLSIGHSLILPRAHYVAFTQVIRDVPEQVRETSQRLLTAVDQLGSASAVLEHGSSTDMGAGACIDHAHWHVIATDPEKVEQQMMRDGLGRTELAFDELANLAPRNEPYFLTGNGTRFAMFGVSQSMPRQYLRAVAAQTLGLTPDTHDWAVVQRRDLFFRNLSGLGAIL